MKNFMNKYFQYVIIILFLINNVLLYRIKADGLFITLFMIGITILIAINYLKHQNDDKSSILLLIGYGILILFAKDLINSFFALTMSIIIYIKMFKKSRSVYRIIFLLYFILSIINLTTSLIGNKYYHIRSGSTYYCKESNMIYYKYNDGLSSQIRYGKATYYPIIPLKPIINISYQDREKIRYNEYKSHMFSDECKNY